MRLQRSVDRARHVLGRPIPGEALRPLHGSHREANGQGLVLQQPIEMSYRAVFENSKLNIEAGFGEAMDLFEKKQDAGAMVHAAIDARGRASYTPSIKTAQNYDLIRMFKAFIDVYGHDILLKLWHMADVLGVTWLAIEGYFRHDARHEACDLDIPFDLAFY